MTRTVLLHPGFHKTATTWLQQRLFARHPSFRLLLDHAEIHRLLVAPHDLAFDPEAARQELAPLIDTVPDDAVPVLSSEILCGSPFTGARDSAMLADRLKAVLGEARVLFTVRAQAPVLRSLYQQYLRRGGTKRFEAFLDHTPRPGYHWFDPAFLEFDRLVARYVELFGAENVLVLPQEWLARDGEAFVEALTKFAFGGALPEGFTPPAFDKHFASPPGSANPLIRLSSHFRTTPLNPAAGGMLSPFGNALYRLAFALPWGKSEAARVEAESQRRTRGRFASSNAALQVFCPVPLGELGYEMPAGG